MSLKGKADEVLTIVDRGGFVNRAGNWVDLREPIESAVSGSVLHRPAEYEALVHEASAVGTSAEIEVTDETTQIAMARLCHEGVDNPVLLNFASARNPGGGFRNGAKAQEEDLCRCSALYSCLYPQTEYYEQNRRQTSMLYTDHLIYSPRVPWFRTRSRDEPDDVFYASVITMPAPNAGQALLKGDTAEAVEHTLRRRCGMVLGVARAHGHRDIILGAWGCGVFRNDPALVAGAFDSWLRGPVFSGAFRRVVFAIYDPAKTRATYKAFRSQFAASTPDSPA